MVLVDEEPADRGPMVVRIGVDVGIPRSVKSLQALRRKEGAFRLLRELEILSYFPAFAPRS